MRIEKTVSTVGGMGRQCVVVISFRDLALSKNLFFFSDLQLAA